MLSIRRIHAFLSDRTKQVVINEESSQHTDVTSAIPQGSVLWSLQFVKFINDLPEQVKSDIFLFADYIKILKILQSLMTKVFHKMMLT